MTGLLTDRWNDALRLRFDAPERRNSLTLNVVRGLRATLESDPTQPVVIGSTSPVIFSAGADIKVPDRIRQQISNELYDCYRTIITRPGPVIAVVEGPAVGGGAQLTAAADMRIAGIGARWQWVGLGHGLVVGEWILPTLLGRGRTLDLALTARWVDANEAMAMGLISRISDDPWLEAAHLLAHLTRINADAIANLKRLSLANGLLEALEAERQTNSAWDGRPPKAQLKSSTRSTLEG